MSHYKEWACDQEITYVLAVLVNGVETALITTADFDSLAEQQHKLSHAVEVELSSQYEDLATIEDEDRGIL